MSLTTLDPVAAARAALVAGIGQAPETWAALWAAYWAARNLPAPPVEGPLDWHRWQEPVERQQTEEAA